MLKRVGIFALMLVGVAGVFPRRAFAQEGYSDRPNYYQRDRNWDRHERHEWREREREERRAEEWRERRWRSQEWREREWREHGRWENRWNRDNHNREFYFGFEY